MLIHILFLTLGFALLVGGAELLVRGASHLAVRFGITPLTIGLTVVAFGTSAPELAISFQAGFSGDTNLLIGNLVGTNIFNILFILGISALITPLVVDQKLIRVDIPFMIAVSLLVFGLSWDTFISRWDAILLLVILVSYLGYLFYESSKEQNPSVLQEYEDAFSPSRSADNIHWSLHILSIIIGLGLLALGSNWLVKSASQIALMLGVSSTIIGLTIISAGTSLPEVATSVMAGIKGERDIAVGNVVGSNIFNLLGVLGISGLAFPDPISIEPGILALDLPFMTAITLASLPIFFTGHKISRWEGILFLGYYAAYLLYLLLNANQHNLLPLFNNVMLWFVLPITCITILVVTYRELTQK